MAASEVQEQIFFRTSPSDKVFILTLTLTFSKKITKDLYLKELGFVICELLKN